MKTIVEAPNVKDILTKQRKISFLLRQEPIIKRKRRLIKLEDWILRNRERIQAAVYEDFQKSAEEVDISEIYTVLTEIRDAKRNLGNWVRSKKVFPSLTYLGTKGSIYYEPKGVCLIISPWNYPFNLTVGPLVSALAAGNAVSIKPSEFTPATSQLIEDMCRELFEEDLCVVFQGDYKVSQELLSYPFDHIFFTGSPKVGKIVMEAAAKHLTSVTLELGGKSPTIVDETANLKDAAEKTAWGKWLNAGQTCVAPDYLFIHKSVKDRFLTELEKAAKKIYSKEENYTGIINEGHFSRLNSLVEDAVEKGGQVVFSSEYSSQLKMGPVVLDNLAVDSEIMEEEIFGPVFPVVTFNDLDEVVNYINERPKPLALYHFSNSSKNTKKVMVGTSAGSHVINDCVLQFSHPELPFGGVNNSGIGKGHGHFGFLEFSNQKSVLKQRKGLTMAKTLYPPFSGLKKKTLELLLKYF